MVTLVFDRCPQFRAPVADETTVWLQRHIAHSNGLFRAEKNTQICENSHENYTKA